MKSTNLILTFLLGALFFTSCQQDLCFTKDQFLDSYDAFIKELDEADDDISDNMKKDFEDRFQSLVENCYKQHKPDLTLKEKQEFWKSSVKYYVAKEGNEITIKLSKPESDFEKYVEAEIKEVLEESGGVFFRTLEKIMEENIPDLIDNVAKELEKFAEDLEKAFEEK